jgi:integrase/recombinase XerD
MTNGLTRQAKALTDTQFRALLRYAEEETHFPSRNRVVVLLSFKAGLRAKEIACVTWGMLTDTEGNVTDALSLSNDATKGKSGRVIPLHPDLKAALVTLHAHEVAKGRVAPDAFVVTLKKGSSDAVTRSNSVQFLFKDWYAKLGFTGASSHSGRRTFITKAARKVSEVGGSLRDVQALAGHASIQITQRYVDTDPEAQRKLVDKL